VSDNNPSASIPDTLARKILIVEGDAVERDLLRLVLEREGYHVDTTGDPLQAETYILKRQYHAVILELLLPGLNGMKLIKNIRENTEAFQPRFILISALGFREVVSQVAALQVSGFLKKPVDPAVLLQRLAALV